MLPRPQDRQTAPPARQPDIFRISGTAARRMGLSRRGHCPEPNPRPKRDTSINPTITAIGATLPLAFSDISIPAALCRIAARSPIAIMISSHVISAMEMPHTILPPAKARAERIRPSSTIVLRSSLVLLFPYCYSFSVIIFINLLLYSPATLLIAS